MDDYAAEIEARIERIKALALSAPPALALSVLRGMATALGEPPRPPTCEWRGALLEKASCGCADRNVYECRRPGGEVNGKPAPVSGKMCRDCRFRSLAPATADA